MNFTELRDELFARGTNYLEEDAEGITRAERWLNQAYREILNLHAWPFLQTFSVGSSGTVSIPDIRKILFVTDSTGYAGALGGPHLDRTTIEDLVLEGLDPAQTGTPERYYVSNAGAAVTAWPQSGDIRVDYIKRVAPMSGTDTPVFSEEYHNLIVDKAMVKAYVDSDNYEAAAALRLEFDAGVTAMAEDYLLDSREVQFIYVDPYDG